MPMFDFRCRKCGHQFEELVGRQEIPSCPTCQDKNVEKLVSAPAGHVAGGGRSLPVMGACSPPPGQHTCGTGCRHA
ncbi:MAG: zinc ribbon domain-containing protein [Planctomycetota bacterium]|nr:MAG: zinc ribbon domain-containing protein [Planctomycetota bacterium]